MIGTIKTIVAGKGFGFIVGENGLEYFFHASNVERPDTIDSLEKGDRVEFEDDMGPKGPFAFDVRIA